MSRRPDDSSLRWISVRCELRFALRVHGPKFILTPRPIPPSLPLDLSWSVLSPSPAARHTSPPLTPAGFVFLGQEVHHVRNTRRDSRRRRWRRCQGSSLRAVRDLYQGRGSEGSLASRFLSSAPAFLSLRHPVRASLPFLPTKRAGIVGNASRRPRNVVESRPAPSQSR